MIAPAQGRSSRLEAAMAAARSCGVTRVGEITGLDRVGVPVFQAVRPWSRSLSVHAGKGLDAEAAQLGALMEAVESAHAEAFAPEGVVAPFASHALDARAPALSDFASSRDEVPSEDELLTWVAARRVLAHDALWVPLEAVSLDFTRRGDRRLERSSNGLGAHFSPADAASAAILELIERDAVAAWMARPAIARAQDVLELASIPFDWFVELLARIRRAGLMVSVFLNPAAVPVPVFLCQLLEPGEARVSARAYGTGCHPSPEMALRKAVLEALQSRLTLIAGARDDVFQTEAAEAFGFALPLPPGRMGLHWHALAAGFADGPDPRPQTLAEILAAAGYPDCALVDLAPEGAPVSVVKAFCPGLGAFARARRAPLPC